MSQHDLEPTPSQIQTPGKLFFGLVKSYFNFAPHRVVVLLILFIVTGLLEGMGILILMPMLNLVGVSTHEVSSKVGRFIAGIFETIHVQPSLGPVLLLFAFVMVGQICLRQIMESGNVKAENGYVVYLRERLYAAVIRANWLFYSRQRASSVTQALTQEIQSIGSASQQLISILGSLIVALIQLSITFALSPKLTAIALCAGGFLLIIIRPFTQKTQVLGVQSQSKRTEMHGAISEHLHSLKLAKSHGQQEKQYEHYKRVIETISAQAIRINRMFAHAKAAYEVGAILCLTAFLYIAITFSHLKTPELLLFMFIFTRILPKLSSLQSSYHRVSQTLPGFQHVEALTSAFSQARENLPDTAATHSRINLDSSIQLCDVSFRYGDDLKWVLKDVTLQLPQGKTTALCGRSGSGKSTLADILLGLLTPTHGTVLINGKLLAGECLQQWRQSVAYVAQDPFLFHDTIRVNLTWSSDSATEEELWEALRYAAAYDMVKALPQGLDTVVGDRGLRLSGGERQRLTLARALLRKPTFLLLDEATSSLDVENEKLIQNALQQLHGSLTVLIIAHRLSTVREADAILVIEEGKIVEQGTWAELNRQEGAYFRKWVAVAEGEESGSFEVPPKATSTL